MANALSLGVFGRYAREQSRAARTAPRRARQPGSGDWYSCGRVRACRRSGSPHRRGVRYQAQAGLSGQCVGLAVVVAAGVPRRGLPCEVRVGAR